MNPSRSFEDLIVWQKAHQFVLKVYKFVLKFPKEEIYALNPQLRRAAISVPANIAEGFKRKGKNDKLRFLNIADASLEECRYYLILSRDLKYGEDVEMNSVLIEVSKLLDAYSKKIIQSLED